ncbi:winged helix-turn-helix domain-containing protein [Ideonella azotifigens]|uniref:OmpR/PhoB-type domain-containing protein n=1 Tax=Ideonella azotifigens TaxID=513160 RepID=A0ABN1K712_9BURK|nr:winged helix-turn-helix domain-containing protein [Ideonella azotifigens]MCD2342182.1 winged helix-turn-helix domain-containing protein [Ideonella azotifigens]
MDTQGHAASPTTFRLGDWQVDPATDRLWRGGEATPLDSRAMAMLAHLASRPGEVVSIDELLSAAWADVVVSQDSVYQAITTLRRALGDSTREPSYIATVPRRGYRLIAAVGPVEPAPRAVAAAEAAPAVASGPPPSPAPAAHQGRKAARLVSALAILLLALTLGLAWWAPWHSAPGTSVAVMPFLDLTNAMDEEPFADGMTEQLIESLAHLPGVRVPSRTSTFFYKDKQATIPEIAHALDVAYVLEGSVRKSGQTLRVTARLVRASDATQLWSETYDRQATDVLAIQDDIAAKVGRALAAAWGGQK